MGIHGFTGIQSILYHVRPPTRVQQVELLQTVDINYEEPGALRHRQLETQDFPEGGDAVSGRVPLLGNADLLISVVRPNRPMDYWYRFAHGDEIIFVHEGTGVLESQFAEFAT